MKTRVSKTNILFVAVMLLLVFVTCFTMFGKTNSWLRITEDITFTVDVNQINITVRQGARLPRGARLFRQKQPAFASALRQFVFHWRHCDGFGVTTGYPARRQLWRLQRLRCRLPRRALRHRAARWQKMYFVPPTKKRGF